MIHLAKDNRYHKQIKHIDMRYHKIRQWVVDDKMINLVKISTKKNPANMMTKTIPVKKFRVSLNFIKILQRKNDERALGRGPCEVTKGGERKENEVETNFYEGTQ